MLVSWDVLSVSSTRETEPVNTHTHTFIYINQSIIPIYLFQIIDLYGLEAGQPEIRGAGKQPKTFGQELIL